MFQISSEVLRFLNTAPATILVAPDAPKFTILYANPAYHQATLTSPEDILGLGFLEAFPENPEDPEGDNVEVLRNGLIDCIATKKRVELPGKRYDVPIRGTDQFETKYWQASNNPVFDERGDILYISHVTVEITGAYDLAKKERIAREVTEAKQRDLHSLLLEAPAAIAILDGPDFIFEFENTIHQHIYPNKELLGRAFTEVFPEKVESFLPILEKIYYKGESYEEKEAIIRLNEKGEDAPKFEYWNFIYKPRVNSNSSIDGIILFGYQVTEQVISRTRVEQSEKRLQTLLETMAEGIGIVNRQGKIIYANPMAEKLLGVRKEQITQRSYHDPQWQNLRTDGTPLPPEEHPMYITMNTGEPVFDHEVGVQPPRGEPFYISINAAPLKDDNGNITGGIGTFMDVTQRRKSAQMKDEFISTVSHELKTPLTSIKAYLQMLDRSLAGYENSNSGRFLNRLNVQVFRLETLIKDFLDVTRIDSNKLTLRSIEFEMDTVLKELVEDLQLVTPGHELKIIKTEPIHVVTDQNRIVQVLTNLITNAVKYSPAANEVHISLGKENNEMICNVQDFGIGIAENQKERIFDRFHQVANNKGSGLSLGLGLYISKEIVERAGGRIWLDSEVGKGSTFYFSLPL
ncbi:ATP-binding protein [Desertivirga arenae]|uniref:ATP-binding protein n=1 Tax=Desertivirga arenae TaxID=2810309 RepID=UPI001A96BD78|nr:ATP-binding protein [Pedobacter sp. SYSU D00823]